MTPTRERIAEIIYQCQLVGGNKFYMDAFRKCADAILADLNDDESPQPASCDEQELRKLAMSCGMERDDQDGNTLGEMVECISATIADLRKRLAAVGGERWVSVKDAMPETGAKVLIATSAAVGCAFLDSATKMWHWHGAWGNPEPTHWREMPPPPAVGEGKT